VLLKESLLVICQSILLFNEFWDADLHGLFWELYFKMAISQQKSGRLHLSQEHKFASEYDRALAFLIFTLYL